MNSEKVKYFLSMSDNMNEDVFIFSVFPLVKRGYHRNFILLRGVCPLRDCYLHLRDFCLMQDCYCSSFYPFGGQASPEYLLRYFCF